jgi:trigger factor
LKATVSTPESWKRVIDVEISVEEVNGAFEEKINKYRKELRLPGFRPGKVPESLIKQRFGSSIKAEAIDELVQKSFKESCEQNNIVPIAPAKVNDVKANDDEPVTFKIEAEIDPEIEISGYNKLKVKSSPKKVKDSDVDEALKQVQDRFAEFKDVDRPSKKGDYIRFEYLKVVIDGQEQSDVKNPTYPIELGGESKLKDFDKGLIGHAANDVVDLSIKFPKDYSEEDVAGKSGEFQVKIIAVQEKILPEMNEEFFKKLGNFADEAALKVDIKANLEKEAIEKGKNEAYNEAIEKLINDNAFDIPPARIEQFVDYMQQESTRYAKPGTPVPSREEIFERYKETAVKSLKRQRIIDFIAKKENIKASQEDVDKEVLRLSEMYGQPFETLKQTFRKNGTTNRIRDDIREQKTLDFLIGEYTPEQQ